MCHGTCERNQVDTQLATGTDATSTACLDESGPGSRCQVDNDCPETYDCRQFDHPRNGLPIGKICMAHAEIRSTTCDRLCPDNTAFLIGATCNSIANIDPTKPSTESICLEDCLASTNGVDTTVKQTCRLDQIATLNTNTCTCNSRDPYGTACTHLNAPCVGPPNTQWSGNPRSCRMITATNLRCVESDFCLAETLATCTNGVDENCDGVAEADEQACKVMACPDSDHDGYTRTTGCLSVYTGAIPSGYSASTKREADACDNDAAQTPPFLPNQQEHGPNDRCFVCTDGLCFPDGVGQGCGCTNGYQCNPASLRCDLLPVTLLD